MKRKIKMLFGAVVCIVSLMVLLFLAFLIGCGGLTFRQLMFPGIWFTMTMICGAILAIENEA